MTVRAYRPWPNVALLCLALLFYCQCSVHAAPKKPSRKSVVDYYYLLPSFYFEGQYSGAQRKASLTELSAAEAVDARNDYIRVKLDSLGTLEVAVFRYQGRDLIAVRRYYEGCGLWFLRHEHDRWKDVTARVMPVRMNRNLDYVIPRYGTTIQVRRDLLAEQQAGAHLYDLVWRKGRFAVRN